LLVAKIHLIYLQKLYPQTGKLGKIYDVHVVDNKECQLYN